ncbi:hypothetical protein, partial [Enterococcus faecium]|uniref:hypothetical protein n=2 Tax=Enterococcus faecium TaxID=1352 RepID=UPI0010251D73
TVTLIPNGIHHPPIEDGRLLPNSVKRNGIKYRYNNYLMLNIINGGEIVNILNEKRYVWFAGKKYINPWC